MRRQPKKNFSTSLLPKSRSFGIASGLTLALNGEDRHHATLLTGYHQLATEVLNLSISPRKKINVTAYDQLDPLMKRFNVVNPVAFFWGYKNVPTGSFLFQKSLHHFQPSVKLTHASHSVVLRQCNRCSKFKEGVKDWTCHYEFCDGAGVFVCEDCEGGDAKHCGICRRSRDGQGAGSRSTQTTTTPTHHPPI